MADAEVAQLLADRAGLAHLRQERSSAPRRCPSPSRRRSAATPARRAIRRRGSSPRILSASRFRSSSRRIDADVRIEQEQVDAVELDAVRRAPRRSGRASCRDRSAARRRAAFADQARPHRVVESWVFMCVHRRLSAIVTVSSVSASGLPGPKCFSITSGSVSLRFSMRTPACAAVGGDEQLVFRHLSEADHRRRRHRQLAERAVALEESSTPRACRGGRPASHPRRSGACDAESAPGCRRTCRADSSHPRAAITPAPSSRSPAASTASFNRNRVRLRAARS